MRDLELRGAGNLLGADQSGCASQIGLDAYMRLLKKTVKRIEKGEAEIEWVLLTTVEQALDFPVLELCLMQKFLIEK